MKKLLLIISFGLITQLSYSQVFVQDQNINDLNIEYVELVGINTSMFGVKMKVYVDYGQKVKFLKADSIKDADGKTMKFNTMIHALNFMNKNGWSYVNYSESVIGSKLRYVYLLKKTKN